VSQTLSTGRVRRRNGEQRRYFTFGAADGPFTRSCATDGFEGGEGPTVRYGLILYREGGGAQVVGKGGVGYIAYAAPGFGDERSCFSLPSVVGPWAAWLGDIVRNFLEG
jgi:hypothetical protein